MWHKYDKLFYMKTCTDIPFKNFFIAFFASRKDLATKALWLLSQVFSVILFKLIVFIFEKF